MSAAGGDSSAPSLKRPTLQSRLKEREKELLWQHLEAVNDGDLGRAFELQGQLKEAHKCRRVFEDAQNARTLRVRFWLSVSFLHDLFQALKDPDGNERIAFFFGIRSNGLSIPTSFALPDLASRSFGHARTDPESVHEILLRYHTAGVPLLGQVHTHPGFGPSACAPSSTDLSTHRNMISHYRGLDMVLSQDGYFTAYCLSTEHDIAFHGKGVEHIDGEVYRLVL